MQWAELCIAIWLIAFFIDCDCLRHFPVWSQLAWLRVRYSGVWFAVFWAISHSQYPSLSSGIATTPRPHTLVLLNGAQIFGAQFTGPPVLWLVCLLYHITIRSSFNLRSRLPAALFQVSVFFVVPICRYWENSASGNRVIFVNCCLWVHITLIMW